MEVYEKRGGVGVVCCEPTHPSMHPRAVPSKFKITLHKKASLPLKVQVRLSGGAGAIGTVQQQGHHAIAAPPCKGGRPMRAAAFTQ